MKRSLDNSDYAFVIFMLLLPCNRWHYKVLSKIFVSFNNCIYEWNIWGKVQDIVQVLQFTRHVTGIICWVSVARSCVLFCRLSFVILSFSTWQLSSLSLFHFRQLVRILLITHLVRVPIKDYALYMCCLSAKHATLRRKNKYWVAWNQTNMGCHPRTVVSVR
jgi:hypothetical protein